MRSLSDETRGHVLRTSQNLLRQVRDSEMTIRTQYARERGNRAVVIVLSKSASRGRTEGQDPFSTPNPQVC